MTSYATKDQVERGRAMLDHIMGWDLADKPDVMTVVVYRRDPITDTVRWSDAGGDPVADLRWWTDEVMSKSAPAHARLIMSLRNWFVVERWIRGKPITKRAWRRYRGRARQ